jgi:hypothetical protein
MEGQEEARAGKCDALPEATTSGSASHVRTVTSLRRHGASTARMIWEVSRVAPSR